MLSHLGLGLARGRLAAPRLARACSSAPPPPEIISVTVEELRDSAAGGAANLRDGELGAPVEEMVEFWRERGMPHDLSTALGSRADPRGGVWADPPTLHLRLARVLQLLPLTSPTRRSRWRQSSG